MERLFLIGFEKDPDEVYIGFEPQWFADKEYGTGLRVIAWRRDGFVDVYQQPSLPLERNFGVAGKGLADIEQRTMDTAHFYVTPLGVDVSFGFEDKLGRPINVHIAERHPKPKKPFTILAPVGSSSFAPSALPAFFLYGFDFVRRSKTEVLIEIAGRRHRPDTFPFPLNGQLVYYMRYSADTFLFDWCPQAANQILVPLQGFNEAIAHGKTVYEISHREVHPELKRIYVTNKQHKADISFLPPFPDMACLDNTTTKGKFRIMADGDAGAIGGDYTVSRSDSRIIVTLCPSEGWTPQPQTLFLKFLFKVAKVFRDWPKGYSWVAELEYKDTAMRLVESKWTKA